MVKDTIQYLGQITIIGTIFGFIVQAYMNRKTAKMIQDAANKQTQNVETLKNELSIRAIIQGKLYEKKLDVIINMYKKLVELSGYMNYMVSGKLVFEGEDAEEKQKKSVGDAQKAIAEFNNYVLYNILFFNKEHANLLEKIRKEYYDANFDFFTIQRLMSFTGGRATEYGQSGAYIKVKEASKRIQEDLPKSIKQMEDEFRKLMGVED